MRFVDGPIAPVDCVSQSRPKVCEVPSSFCPSGRSVPFGATCRFCCRYVAVSRPIGAGHNPCRAARAGAVPHRGRGGGAVAASEHRADSRGRRGRRISRTCALEFVEGGNLAGKIDGKPMPAREAARLVEALARAMQLAHSRNVVHRDLKPANILLTADGTPKITDFGLARQLDSDSGETQAGAVMGTPSYMAPEQASGHAHEAGPAADIYALGAILYACLAGRPPFQGGTVTETREQKAERWARYRSDIAAASAALQVQNDRRRTVAPSKMLRSSTATGNGSTSTASSTAPASFLACQAGGFVRSS